MRGLLSDEERKNSWTLSERAGHGTPDGMQRLLSTTDWDPDAVRDDLFTYVNRHLGDPDGILIIDLCRARDYAEGIPAASESGQWRFGFLEDVNHAVSA